MGLQGNRAGDGAAGQWHCLYLFLKDGPLAAPSAAVLPADSPCQRRRQQQEQERKGEQQRPSTGRGAWDLHASGARAGQAAGAVS